MSPHEAFELAQSILNDYDHIDVIAVGRFVPIEQATSSTPWAISVSIDGNDRPTVIREASDLDGLGDGTQKPAPRPAMQESLF